MAVLTARVSVSWPVNMAWAKPALLIILCAAGLAGFLATNHATCALAVAHDGAALTRLMRFMAVVKAAMALAAASALFWRFGGPVRLNWFAAYAVSAAAMAAGPGLIWGMVHVGLGALCLHGGLFATILLLWRDPATSARLQAMVTARRSPVRL